MFQIRKEWEERQDSDLFRKMVSSYRKFIDELVQKNEVLTKSFYIVIPFSVYEMGLQSAKVGMASIFPFLPSSKKVNDSLSLPINQILKRAKANLEPKKDHIVRAFGRLGLKIRQLETKELINLFYSIYNEGSVSIKNTTVENMNSPVTLKK